VRGGWSGGEASVDAFQDPHFFTAFAAGEGGGGLPCFDEREVVLEHAVEVVARGAERRALVLVFVGFPWFEVEDGEEVAAGAEGGVDGGGVVGAEVWGDGAVAGVFEDPVERVEEGGMGFGEEVGEEDGDRGERGAAGVGEGDGGGSDVDADDGGGAG